MTRGAAVKVPRPGGSSFAPRIVRPVEVTVVSDVWYTSASFRNSPTNAMKTVPAAVMLSLLATTTAATAEPASDDEAGEGAAVHLQFTTVAQRHPKFASPYQGTNSLTPVGVTEETTDVTAYLGVRPWRGAELWANPEVDQGFGFDKTVGLAGFSSGEAYKVGANAPYLRLPRLFLRQTFALGGEVQDVEGKANQLAGKTTGDSLVLTVGKLSVVDVFDNNRYAHDPRGDFLNWSVIDVGTFDYAADAWGFTYGGAAELTQGDWTGRLGFFELSKAPNGKIVAVDFGQWSSMVEVERRQSWFGRPGKVSVLGYVDRAAMGSYQDATALAQRTGNAADIALVRKRASKAGVSLDVEQEVADDVGLFVRAGLNDGRKEAYEFTEINRTIAAGASVGGRLWNRTDDVFGVAAVVNGLSRQARDFFAAGGLGILIGDGRLDYGNEAIVETYYAARLTSFARLTVDYQHVDHPAYNRDRGPVSIYSARLHLEY
jgi:high affinity Mn2+ porin